MTKVQYLKMSTVLKVKPADMQTVPTVAPAEVTLNPHESTWQGYKAYVFKNLGAAQIVLGGACIILQIAAIIINSGFFVIGHGFWCGIFFIIAGTFGIAAGNTKRRIHIITYMILSIIAATLVCPLVALAALGLYIDDAPNRYYYKTNTQEHMKKIVVDGLMIAVAICEGFVAIASSAICCGPLCCPSSTTGTVYAQGQLQYNPTTGQQVVVLTMPPGGQPQCVKPSGGNPQNPQYVMQPTVRTIQSGLPANTSISHAAPTKPPAFLETSDHVQDPPYDPQMVARAYNHLPAKDNSRQLHDE